MLGKVSAKVPIQLAGLLLGVASAGAMLPGLKWVSGVIAGIILVFLTLKIIHSLGRFEELLKTPIPCGTACALPMGIAVFSTYFEPIAFRASYAIWMIALIAHAALIIYFTFDLASRFDIRKLLLCCFLAYVGITIGAVVTPVYGAIRLGTVLFWFGFISYLVLLPLILYSVVVMKSISEPNIPTIAVFAAPASLCLAGYLRSVESPDVLIVAILFILSAASYFIVLALFPRMLRVKFHPSCSAFTFPSVISAIATSATYSYLLKIGVNSDALKLLSYAEMVLALLIVVYVLIMYIDHFLIRGGLCA